jgi:hypothetical protein
LTINWERDRRGGIQSAPNVSGYVLLGHPMT